MKEFMRVDLHKKTTVICGVDQDRQVLPTRSFARGETERIAQWFAQQRPFEAAI